MAVYLVIYNKLVRGEAQGVLQTIQVAVVKFYDKSVTEGVAKLNYELDYSGMGVRILRRTEFYLFSRALD
jgi:hypothetical protein